MRVLFFILTFLVSIPAFSQIGMTLRRGVDTTGAGGGGITDPTDIPDLELWLDGSDVDGDGTQEGTSEATLTGTQVDDWIDKSGNGRNFSRSGSPQLQSISGTLYSIAGDGNDHFVSDDAASTWTFLHSDDVTVIVRAEVNNVNSASSYVFMATTSSSASVGITFAWSDIGASLSLDSDVYWIGANGTTQRNIYNSLNTGSVWTTSNTFYDVVVWTDVSASKANRIEAEIDGSTAAYQADVGGDGIASSSDPSSTLHLFAQPSPSAYLIGSIAEIIVYSRKLTAQEIDDLQDYLNNKY